jgi:hypothetical protein
VYEQLYLSALVRDCDMSASVLDLGDADHVRELWQKARGQFSALGQLHAKEYEVLTKASRKRSSVAAMDTKLETPPLT